MAAEQVMISTFQKFGIQISFTSETLLSDLGVDSLMILELVIDFEEQLGFAFADDDLVKTNFETVGSVMSLVEKYVLPAQ